MAERMDCPFGCGFSTAAPDDTLALHVEQFHSDGESPFVVDQDVKRQATPDAAGSSSEDEQFAECPIDGCGEIVTLAELDDHIELHAAEDTGAAPAAAVSLDRAHVQERDDRYASPYESTRDQQEVGPAKRPHRTNKSPTTGGDPRQQGAIYRWKEIFGMGSPRKRDRSETPTDGPNQKRRLGKAELGKYAHEEKMPDWLVSLLRNEGQVTCDGVIPVLAQLLQVSDSTKYAYLCHPSVCHVSKLRREGGFCGYRNIQMMSSYIIGTGHEGASHFRGRLPSIFKIQDWIEHAWDLGINAQGRIETGGVRGTRKYIGTPEAQAMFLSLEIPCEAQGFRDPRPGAAEAKLMDSVEAYFQMADFDPNKKVRCTSLPPIYFQHRGHSLTIVGLERHRDGTIELLVFDPMFHDSPNVTKYIGRSVQTRSPEGLLKLYRRGNRYLKKYHEFEVLRLKVSLPQAGEQIPQESI